MTRYIIVISCCLFLLFACRWDYLEPFNLPPPPPPPGDISYDKVIQPIFTLSCLGSGCHGGDFPPNLSSGISHNELTATQPGFCTAYSAFVDTSNASSSLLYVKLFATTPCGNIMPGGGLPQNEKDSVLKWIEQGAQNN